MGNTRSTGTRGLYTLAVGSADPAEDANYLYIEAVGFMCLCRAVKDSGLKMGIRRADNGVDEVGIWGEASEIKEALAEVAEEMHGYPGLIRDDCFYWQEQKLDLDGVSDKELDEAVSRFEGSPSVDGEPVSE